jgi:hypothetical protein
MNQPSTDFSDAAKSSGTMSGDQSETRMLERSLLYREVLAEREEILRHKWIESERAGRDIGFEAALVSWVVHHCGQWRKARRESGSARV